MFPIPKPELLPNTYAYESEPLVKPTGFREYDARWLLGKEITLADVAVMPSLVRIHDLGIPDWQDLPRVVTWFDNIRAQSAFKPTFYHGSLLSERFPHLREKGPPPLPPV